MQTEIEAKWLNVDKDILRKKLKNVGAELVRSERAMFRRNYDFQDRRLESVGGWVRVRDEGSEVTMSYKQLDDRSAHGMKEVTVVVDDFNATCDFLISIGLEVKSTQEIKRESWKFGDTEIEIDTWPWIPSFVEIEAKNEADLKKVAEILGFDYSKALYGSVEPVYQAVYDVTEAEINSWKEIRFIDTPDWLLAKKLR